MLIDSHSHIYDHEFFAPEEAEEVLNRCFKNGTKKIVMIGTNPTDSLEAHDYCQKWNTYRKETNAGLPELFWTFGIHPEFAGQDHEIPDFDPEDLPIAIGEVGLDYHYDAELKDPAKNHEKQKKLFREMLDLAVKYDLPLSLHIRDAIPDALEIMDEYTDDYLTAHGYTVNDDPTEKGQSRLRAVVHSFSDSKKNLKKCLARGFFIGVNGLATYSTLPLAPLERTLTETDAPFLIPAPFHEPHQPGDGSPVYGRHRNDSSYIKYVVEWLAKQHGVSPAIVEKAVEENTKKLYKI